MEKFTLELEAIQDLDIKSGRLAGITQNPLYGPIVEKYALDLAQCFLWLDSVRLLSYVMEEYDFEDTSITLEELGLTGKKVWEERQRKFPFLTEFMNAAALLNEPLQLGTTIKEIVEDINLVYEDLQRELQEIFPDQDQITRLVDGLV